MRSFLTALLVWILYGSVGLAQNPEQFGGIYYAYDVQTDSMPEPPVGYRPVYISHYGRHGSRWPVNPKAYTVTLDFFKNQDSLKNLTEKGKEVWKIAALCADNAKGHLGELTPLGERQHRDIAARMARRFPSLFREESKVEARSSVEPRCIMSMAAFCESLKNMNAGLRIQRHASPGDMEFIHHKTDEASLMNSDNAPWRHDFDAMRDSLSLARGMIKKLFKQNPSDDKETAAYLPLFARSLYDIAISTQDIDDIDADLLSLFSQEELENLWTAANYIQYVGNACSPISGSAGPACVRPLLDEIVERADSMLQSGEISVDLRFGHDTDLLRLVSLLDINGYGIESEDPKEVADKWRNFDISPMGANIQFIFYKNDEGDIIMLPRLNEQPVKLHGLSEVAPGFYSWQAFKNKKRTL